MSHPSNGNLELANASTSPCYAILILLMIALCIINCLTHFFSVHVNKLTTCSAISTKIYKTTADHRKYHSPLDGHHYKDSEA